VLIYHLARAGDWEAALADGAYRVSTIGRTLDEEGFVHCACEEQVAGVRERYYRGSDDLVVLAVDVERLSADVRFEDGGGGELFPHVYGPIPVDAVVAVTPG
jgi:uncharacterized protein (DUF952 family)